jgi:DNA polymerase
VDSPNFRVLLAALVWVDEDTKELESTVLDFVMDEEAAAKELMYLIGDRTVVAHNAQFERAVLANLDLPLPVDRFVDSAAMARACGFGSSLEAAAPQALGVDKVAAGRHLIQLFSIPHKDQLTAAFDESLVDEHPQDWAEFQYYCKMDAELSLLLAMQLSSHLLDKERHYMDITMYMNTIGWNVDMKAVKEMWRRYGFNREMAVQEFREACNAPDLNLDSFKQCSEWCAERGVRARSFNKEHVEQMLKSLRRKLLLPTVVGDKRRKYEEVVRLLETKQIVGGSSLKKLETITNTICKCGRLHDQYLHIGAAATYRTSGRGVQMQNLKRLEGEGDDMTELFVPDTDWTNDKLAANLRQVFTAANPKGQLIVGDFSSVESRGLAWLAGEQWKLDAYRAGEDLYKVLAGIIFHKDTKDVSKGERQIGKVGELACGYGAGAGAVREFAALMGVELSEAEAAKLVSDWRKANPAIVQLWDSLDRSMKETLETGVPRMIGTRHGYITFEREAAPESLCKQLNDPDLHSLRVGFLLRDQEEAYFERVLHGTRLRGKTVTYWKPSDRKTGDLWKDRFTDPKTGVQRMYTVYGGKLAGLLTQSLCREIFFESLNQVFEWTLDKDNVWPIGQFHDEIVLEWEPGDQWQSDLGATMEVLGRCMTTTSLPGFPLDAVVKHDHRYIK